jgi:beta-phosphoglucomutase-like phosphatase (HAD superfamily)
VFVAFSLLVLGWLLAWGGFRYFHQSKMTAEKVASYLDSIELSRLQGDARARALTKLAEMMNALTPEERRHARLDGRWEKWFADMTEQEKAAFIDATMPSGFKQMLSSFEQLTPDKRQRAVEQALEGLERSRRQMETADPTLAPSQRATELSPELRDKVVKIGLKSFYNESSAQTKAELAPVLEEMQRLMERGVLLRRQR